jgi:hypothetical protein
MRVYYSVCVTQPCTTVSAADVLYGVQVWWFIDQPCCGHDMALGALLSIVHVAPVCTCMTVAAVQEVFIIAHLLFVSAEVCWFFDVCQDDCIFEIFHSESLWALAKTGFDGSSVDRHSGFLSTLIVADLDDVHMQQCTHAPMLTVLTVHSTVDVC